MKNIKLLFTVVLVALTASVGWSQSLTTLFAANNGGSFGGAVYFDITVGPNAINITDLDVNTADGNGGAFSLDVYAVVGNSAGNETNGGFWGAPVTSGSGTAAGLNNPSNAALNTPVALNANTTYAIAIVMDASHGHDYTNGNGANQMHSNADLTINLGQASNVPFTGGIFSPRVWNGTVYYTVGGGPPPPPPGGCTPFTVAGPYCNPCNDPSGGSALACSLGPNSIIQGIDASGLPGPSFVNSIDFNQESFGTASTIDVHLFCAPAAGPVPYNANAANPPFYSETFAISPANDGTCVNLAFTTPPTIDASCGTMWIEIISPVVGRAVQTPPTCDGSAGSGVNSWLIGTACGISVPTTFAAIGFGNLDASYAATFEEVSCGGACDLVLVSVTGSAGVTCGNTGTIDIVATSSAPPIVYSIGGPVSETNGTGNFSGLPAGTYVISVVDQAGCATTDMVTLDPDITPPTITCPPNQTLTCFEGVPAPFYDINDWIAAGGTYTDNCPPNGVTIINVNDSNGGDNCPGNGLILTRTYTVSDEAGNAATCTQTFTYLESTQGPAITSILPTCYKFCASLANPEETDITYTTDCSFDGVVTITGPQVIGPENCPGTIYRYTYSVTDACGRVSPFGVNDRRDFIIGNDGPTIQCPATNLLLECGDPNNADYIAAHVALSTATSSCGLSVNITHFPTNFNNIACNTATTVTFTATDDCGRTATCTTIVNISDNTAPVITSTYVDGICNEAICGSNLNFWFNNWKNKVWAGLSATDACDSNVSITLSSPFNPNSDCPDGTAETTLTWVAHDNCGNTSGVSYSFYVIPADSPAPAGNISGILATEETETVENVAVTLDGNNSQELYQSAADGMYGFAGLALEQNYSVTPYLNEEPLNGVTSFDLVLISKHILQIQQLDSPYKMIAADINKTGSITTMDLLELRKMILHINETFPENTSWRFIEAAFIFPDANNPFATVFPEAVNINGLTGNEQHDFVAVKVGDVNASAVPNATAGADDRTIVGDLVFNVADQQLNAGETYEVAFKADNFDAIHGYQFSLNYNEAVLEFANVKAGNLTNLNESNFGLTLLEKGVITTSWTNQVAQSVARNAAIFHLTFTAKADALLSEVINISSQYTRAEAYDGNLDLMDVQIRFDEANVTNTFRLYQNTPNPFKATTLIGFELPAATSATLNIYDVSGKLLKTVEGDYEKGYNEVSIEKSDLQASGVIYYRLMTGEFEAIKKMMIVD